MRLVKVQDHSGLVKDMTTGAVLFTDNGDIEKAKRLKESRMRDREEMQQLKDDMQEIKSMLSQILKGSIE
jgi:hypothetical protein